MNWLRERFSNLSISQAWISTQDRQHQLRIAAIEKRLEAHQQAFALWRKLLAAIGNESTLNEIILECQSWWEKNCLYLTPEARGSFVRAYMSAKLHGVLIMGRDVNAIERNWKTITDAGDDIVEGVALPTIGEFESEIVENQQMKKKS